MFSIIIPVYNEEKTIKDVLEIAISIFNDKNFEIIVVDDGSTDNSYSIIKKYEKYIKILRHNKNIGKGRAIITGLNSSKGDFIGIQDADLEYNMKELKKIFKMAEEKDLNAVFGSRVKKKNPVIYLHYLLGNLTMAGITTILFGKLITDPYTCYKVIKRDIFKKMNLTSKSFEIEAEITAKLLKNKINIIEIPISYSPRRLKEGKKIKFKDAIKGALTFLKIRFSR